MAIINHSPVSAAVLTVAERAAGASVRLLPAVSPIFIPDRRGDPELVGSGILLRVGPSHFVITAAHVMTIAKGQLYVGGESRIVPVSGHFSWTRQPPGGGADLIDMAILPLRDQEIGELRDCRFLNVSDLEPGEVPDRRLVLGTKYLLVGYPATKQKRTKDGQVRVEALRYMAKARPPSEYRARGFDPAVHLLIEYDKKKSWSIDGQVMPPDPYGVSGGGIFKLYEWREGPSARETLVAIACEYTGRSGRSVVGTRIDACLQGIATQYPQLQAWLPTH